MAAIREIFQPKMKMVKERLISERSKRYRKIINESIANNGWAKRSGRQLMACEKQWHLPEESTWRSVA